MFVVHVVISSLKLCTCIVCVGEYIIFVYYCSIDKQHSRVIYCAPLQLELQRQQLLSDRQQFQRDQVKAAEMRSLQSPTLAPQTPLQLPPVLRPPPKSIPPAEPIPIPSHHAPSTIGTEEQADSVAMKTTPSEPITMETAPPENTEEESNAKSE